MSTDPFALAVRIGDRLCEQAIWFEGRATWMGDEKENVAGNWEVVHRSLGGDVYGGTAGIGIFLTRLWSVTGDQRYRDTARAAFGFAVDWQDRNHPAGSLYGGSAGIAAAMCEAATAFGSQELGDQAREIALDSLERLPAANDLIAGRAGSIVALLECARALGDENLKSAAVEAGDRLLEEAQGDPYPGAWWRSDIGLHEPPLCGLGHGASGPAWALAELSLATGEARFLELAHAATDYERAWYRPDEGNWPDLREFTRARLSRGEPPAFPMYWCHGAPGIGLVRLRLYELAARTIDAAEAEAVLQSSHRALVQMVTEGSARGLSLCHGIASLAELFCEGARVFEQPQLSVLVDDCVEVAAKLAHGGDGPWPCGVPDGGENPSLMLGVAGIGLMFLRAARPAVAGAGLLYACPVERKRLIVKLEGTPAPQEIQRRAAELSGLLPGSRVERFSRRGRVLLRLPAQASMSEAVAAVADLEDVAYAEPDVVDSAADS